MNTFFLLSLLALTALETYAQESIMLLKAKLKVVFVFITRKRSLRLWMLEQNKCSKGSAL